MDTCSKALIYDYDTVSMTGDSTRRFGRFPVSSPPILARPGAGYLSYLQMVGVGARVADGRLLGSLTSLQDKPFH